MREKHWSVVSRKHPDQGWTCNPGVCPDWESNPRPFATFRWFWATFRFVGWRPTSWATLGWATLIGAVLTPLNVTLSTPSFLLTISSFAPFSWHCDGDVATQSPGCVSPACSQGFPKNSQHQQQAYLKWMVEYTTSPLNSSISRSSGSHSCIQNWATQRLGKQASTWTSTQTLFWNSTGGKISKGPYISTFHPEASISFCSSPVSVFVFMGSD